MSDIEIFPGAPVSPEVLLHRLLEHMQETKGVIVLAVNEHGAVQIYTSCITLNNLAYASLKLQSYAAKVIDGEPPDGAEYFTPKGAA